jgi:hypothetical protein
MHRPARSPARSPRARPLLAPGPLRTTTGNTDETAISYPYPLASGLTVIEVPAGGPTPAGCSGDVDHPGAAAGNLCIFVGWETNNDTAVPGEYDPGPSGVNNRTGLAGAVLYNDGATAAFWEQAGTYAATAS